MATSSTADSPSAQADELALLRAQLAEAERRRFEAETAVGQLERTAFLPFLNPNPILQIQANGHVRFANPAAEKLRAEVLGSAPSVLRPQLLAATSQSLRTGQNEEREIQANGREFLLCAVPMREEQSAVIYLTDITAQRAAERRLREEQQLHNTILNYLPASVSVLDPDQRCVYRNATVALSHGENLREVDTRLGRTFREYCDEFGLPAALAARRERLFERAVRGRQLVEWEEQWPAPEGQAPTYWLRFYQPVYGPDDTLRLVMSYGLDITARRQAEENTRRSEATVLAQQAFTTQVLDANPSCIFVRDASGGLVFANAAMRELLALDEQRQAPELGLGEIVQAEKRQYMAANAEVLRTNQPATIDSAFTLPNGEARWYQAIRRPLLPAGGGPAQVLGVLTDITALKRAQQAAEAAAVARENFLANMSHEIRTPLNGVLGMAGLLAGTPLNAEQQNYLNVVRNSGRNLLAVLNDVLDMAKITSGKLELESIPYDLPAALHTAAQTLAFRAAEQDLRFTVKLPKVLRTPLWVTGDPYRLTQVLLNLLSNAIKFTRAGGVTLDVRVLSRSRSRLRLRVLVQDTGPGIAPERQEAVFDSFTQAYASTTRQHGGTGLGLSISRGLVTQLGGGPLLLCSIPGEGSTFAFTLPLERTTAPAAVAPGSLPAAAAVRGRRVLLVEDNEVNRELARLLLERHGVLVEEAVDGHSALDRFNENRYDAILMDIQMPGMSGLEATAQLRRHADPDRAKTPVIALTANAFRADAERYRAAGLDDTLAKPFEEAELLEKLAGVLRGAAPLPAPSPEPQAAEPEPAPAAPAVSAAYDLTLLYETAHGSTAFVSRILASFHTNTPTTLAELETALTAADWPALAALAHKIRPSLRLLGAAPLAPMLATLEDHAATDPARRSAAEALREGLRQLLAELPKEVS